jgi:hypothetical protein
MRIQRVNRLGVVLFAAGLGVVAAGCFETSTEGVDIVVGPDVQGDVPDAMLPGDVVGDVSEVPDAPACPMLFTFGPYEGAYPKVSLGSVRLCPKDEPGSLRCDSITADSPPTALEGRGPMSLLATSCFDGPNDLETERTQLYTVYCYATEPGSDQRRAHGCVDDVTVEWGVEGFVECPLNDVPPKIVGSYELTTTLNLKSGVPPQVETVLNYIIDFVQSPSSGILRLMCDPGVWGQNGGALQQLCETIFVDPANPDINNLTTIGTIAQDIIDAHLMSLVGGPCPDPADPATCMTVFDPGGGGGDILRTFQLLSTMACTKEPAVTGLIAKGGCTENWHTAAVIWTPGTTCSPSSPTCGQVLLPLAAMPGVGGTFTADIEARLVEKNTKLAITKHPVGLKYGALIDFVMEKFLLPRMFGDGSDGLPAVDSFEALIGALLGGKACIQNGSCCSGFATNLVAQSGGAVGVNLVEGACDQLITLGGPYIRGFLTGLDQETSTFTFGTPVAGGKYTADLPCAISDRNDDMKFDALGGNVLGQQCVWDATVTVGGYDYSPDATFHGTRQ